MPETDPLTKFKLPTNLRALVVDGDDSRRQHVEDSLHAQGVRVIACASVEHGRELFDDHALVITPLNGDNQAVLEFVSWLRTRAGRIQPYVMGLGEYHAPASEWHGFNEFVSLPFEGVKVHSSVEAARRWHGWNVGVNSLLRPEDDEPEEMAPEPAVEAPVAPQPIDTAPAPEVAAVAPPAPPAVEAEPANELLDVAEIFSSETPKLTIPTEAAPAEETQPQQKDEAEPFDWSIAAEAKSLPEETQPPNNGLPRELQLSMAPKAPPAMSASLHQQITEASPFGLLLLDDAANLIYANPQHRNVLGFVRGNCGRPARLAGAGMRGGTWSTARCY